MISFNHKPKGSIVGSGEYAFRHYGNEIVTYTITPTLTNVTAKADNPTTISTGETKLLTYYSDNGLNLPADVAVTGATKNSWVVTNEYAVSGAGTNCLINGQSSASGYVGTSDTLVFNLSANGTTYKLPTTLSIPNATYTRTSDTAGTLSFSGVSADQSFTVVAEEIQSGYTVTVTYESDFTDYSMSTLYLYPDNNRTNYLEFSDSVGSAWGYIMPGGIEFEETDVQVTNNIVLLPESNRQWYSLNGGAKIEFISEITLNITQNSTLHLYISCDV